MEKKNKRRLLSGLFTLVLMFSVFANPIETKAEAEPEQDYLTFKAEENGSTIIYNHYGDTQYSIRTVNGEWSKFEEYVEGKEIILNTGDEVRFKAINDGMCGQFAMTGKIAASGSVTSLTDGNGSNADVILSDRCYERMFDGCTSLTSAPKLPAKKLAWGCYKEMFRGCKNLTQAPELPATMFPEGDTQDIGGLFLGMGCYYRMFSGCTSLTKAPKLPATTLNSMACYAEMFSGCTSLEQAPELPATKLSSGCYNGMFSGCTSLTQVPQLPATELKDHCYTGMFSKCTNLSLRTQPDDTHTVEWKLTAQGGGCWGWYMFYGCDVEGMVEGATEDQPTYCAPELNKVYYTVSLVHGEKFAEYEGNTFIIDENGDVRCFDSNGNPIINNFKCDGTYTYYFQADGTAMKDRLTYHPDGIHVIYFDKDGHEVFSDFANVKKSIAGDAVDDMCFFNVYGYMYVDTLTYDKTGTKLYYVNPYGVLERTGWFAFSGNEFDAGLGFSGRAGGYGYANADCSLVTNTYTYDWDGNYVYIQGDGHMFR